MTFHRKQFSILSLFLASLVFPLLFTNRLVSNNSYVNSLCLALLVLELFLLVSEQVIIPVLLAWLPFSGLHLSILLFYPMMEIPIERPTEIISWIQSVITLSCTWGIVLGTDNNERMRVVKISWIVQCIIWLGSLAVAFGFAFVRAFVSMG